MLRIIDKFLNQFTMYRLVTYGLLLMAAICVLFSLIGLLPYSGLGMLVSLVLLVAGCWVTTHYLAKVWQIPYNNESYLITALILFFILPQSDSIGSALALLLAAVIAMASKFLITRHQAHLFNPAAFAAVTLGLSGLLHASWWVGSGVLWPLTLVLSFAVARKTRRTFMFLIFAFVSMAAYVVSGLQNGIAVYDVLKFAVTTSPLIFLGGIMLTEPATMPWRRTQQVIYATLVALLFAFHPRILGLFVYPETALVLGNIFALAVSPRFRVRLRLKEVRQTATNISSYIFTPDRPVKFQPGQYMEWTTPATIDDMRGNRRTFTIASSPTEPDLMLSMKQYHPSSSYKRAMQSMRPGDYMYAGQLAGDFTLPDDESQKILFIAGGIGITPFRSMLKYMTDQKQRRDIVLLYFVSRPEEVAFQELLHSAVKVGVRSTVVLTAQPAVVSVAKAKSDTAGKPSRQESGRAGETGRLDEDYIKRKVADLDERIVYISGPNAMVGEATRLLVSMGVARSRVRTDYFSGY